MSAEQKGPWQPHAVRKYGKDALLEEYPAKFQIVTESWNRVVAVPYLVYIPEQDRVLMLVNCDCSTNPRHHCFNI